MISTEIVRPPKPPLTNVPCSWPSPSSGRVGEDRDEEADPALQIGFPFQAQLRLVERRRQQRLVPHPHQEFGVTTMGQKEAPGTSV